MGCLTAHVNTIIVNCKLPPDPDAALHGVIGPLLQGANAMKATPARSNAIAGMRRSVEQCARQFDDPAFAETHR